MGITTAKELDDLREKVRLRQEVTLESLRAAVRFLRQGRVTAKPKEKKGKSEKIEANVDDLLGLGG